MISSRLRYMYVGLIIFFGFCTSYILQIYMSGIPLSEVSLYLSLSYPSDPLYLPFINRIENLTFFDSTVFPTIGVLPELLISKYIEFQYIWFMVPILKTFSVVILLTIFISKRHVSVTNILGISVFLFFILSTNSWIFGDRFSRPHIIPTLALVAMFFCSEMQENSRALQLVIAGSLLGIVFEHDAWLFACVLMGGIVYFLMSVNHLKIFAKSVVLVGIGFSLVTFLANLNYLFGTPAHPLYLDFVGLKYIFNSYYFVVDYYTNIFTDRGFLVRFCVAIFIGLLCKDRRFLWVMFGGSLFAFLPFVAVGHVVQAYHIVIASKTFVLLCTLLSLSVYFSESNDCKKFNNLGVSAVFILVMLSNYHDIRSPMVVRATQLYSNYNEIFDDLASEQSFDPACIVISNDTFARAYTLAFTDFQLLPRDGLYVARSISDIQKEVSSAIIIARNSGIDPLIFNDEFIRKSLHYAAHNYFSISRSFVPPSLKDYELKFAANQFDAESFQGWQMRYPEALLSSIKGDAENIFEDKIMNDRAWFIIKNGYQYKDSSDVVEINNCFR